MQVLSAEEVSEGFLTSENLRVQADYVRADKDGLFFAHPEAACIDLKYPILETLPFFARCLATIGYEEQYFAGALIWFKNWGSWQPRDEGIGYRIVEKMNAAAGQPKSFEAGPGHRFRTDEFTDAVGMLLQPMVFAWDCYYLPDWSYGSSSEYFIHVDTDSFVSVVARTREFYDRAFQQLEKLKLNPKPGHKMQMDRFCRRP